MNLNKKPMFMSDMDIEKKLQVIQTTAVDNGESMLGSPKAMFGSEIPMYFLYRDGADAEGVRGVPARLLDIVVNTDDPTKPYIFGDIAVKIGIVGFYAVFRDMELAIIQVETPNDELHHAVVQRGEIDKIYTIIKEWNEAGKEITIKFHEKPQLES